jgi:alpha-galactosidase
MELAGGSTPKGAHYIGCHPGSALRYRSHRDHRTPAGRKLEILQVGEALEVVSHFQFHDDAPLVRVWTELHNLSERPVGLTYVASFALTGLGRVTDGDFGQGLNLWIPYNSWGNEIRWKERSLFDLGWAPMSESTQRISFQQTGTWPCNGTLPMAVLADAKRGTALAWQIEHSGSWHWELGTYGYDVALRLSGPTENENHWFKYLAPGERFVSVTAAVGVVTGNFETAIQALTRYRRIVRRPSPDNEKLPVIFNDYFCLWGNPSMENLRPMIPLAAEIGCEVFCIDCGWYAEGSWADNVGEWKPSAARYPVASRSRLS